MNRNKPLIFNPDEEPKDMLIATFVIRQILFEKIFKVIKESSRNTPPQHFLLVGQRGMGKTTLLLRIKYAIEDDPELANYLVLIRFPEEQYNIGCLPDLWEETVLYLENLNPVFEGLSDELKLHEKKEDYERICFELLTKKLKQHKKRILFLIDNIGDLLHKFTDLENHRLRELLMTSPYLQLIGASSQMLEHSFQYDKPFFEFFYQLKLEPLNKTEAIHLMRALAETYDVTEKINTIINQSPERIEVLRRITGGVPRTLVLLFEIFIDYNYGSAFEDLEHLVDKVLPFYKARMDSLKPQQQKIIDALARAWEAISASDVLEQSKLYRENITSNQVSSQLKQLEDNQLVETVDTGKRKKLYRIRERFFNIWYLMRNGRKQSKDQVLWLIRFLESWCTPAELHDIARRQIENLSDGEYSEKAAYGFAIALHNIDCIVVETKQNLLKLTEDYLLKAEKHDWANTIHKLWEEGDDNHWRAEFFYPWLKKDIKKAEGLFLKAPKNVKDDAEHMMAVLYENDSNHYEKAEAIYLKINKRRNIEVLGPLANLYRKMGKYEKAEEYYLKAVDNDNASAMFNLATFYYHNKKDYSKAEEYYLKAAEKGITNAFFNLGYIYQNIEINYDKAEEYYLKAIEKGDVRGSTNILNLYSKQNNFVKAEEYFLKAIANGELHLFNDLGILYFTKKKDYDKAEEYFLKAIDNGDKEAVLNLGIVYELKKKYEKAEEYYLRAEEEGDRDTLLRLFMFYTTTAKKDIIKASKYLFKLLSFKDFNLHESIFYYHWNRHDYQNALDYCSDIFQLELFFNNLLGPASQLLISILAEEQYHFLLNEFKKENSLLMKYLQPIYYVVAWYLKDELPGEYEKAGSEIKETVDEIIKAVEERKASKTVTI